MTYDYSVHTPIVLAPVNISNTLVLSESRDDKNNIILRVHDLHVVGDEIVSSINFRIRGSQYKLGVFKNEMNRNCDKSRCVGIMFFFRKLYYAGFNTIYIPKKLHPKKNSTLEASLKIVNHAMSEKEE